MLGITFGALGSLRLKAIRKLWSGGVVRPRRLRVQRNRDRGLRHGANLPSFYGKYPLPATLARSTRPLGFVVLNFAPV